VINTILRPLAVALALILAGCEGAARPLLTDPAIVVMTFMPDRASLDAERRRTTKSDPGPVNGFARRSGAACHDLRSGAGHPDPHRMGGDGGTRVAPLP